MTIAGSFAWFLTSLALKPYAAGNYIDIGRQLEPMLLRGALPMALVGAIAVIALAATGRLRRVWTDPNDVPPATRWMRLIIIIPIVITIAGLIRRVVQFGSGRSLSSSSSRR
ncbi:hypothetical protein [Bowdeniella nasicola]|uniref:hypothetical protein n=1 Tax=Bowdeniella nasicola TaxID=208480 RepID=UPI001FEC41A1|nr:hypothetical protein [Bowdeniella nasicola]